jgi:2'-5' RNA ligase
MRLFIAIYPPQEIKEKIRDAIRKFDKEKRNIKFLSMDQLHLTVKFLGNEVSEESLLSITEELRKHISEFKKPTIKLTKLSFGFSRQIRPKTLLFFTAPDKTLDKLTSKVHELVKDLKLQDTVNKKERRRLVHHITVGRARDSVNKAFKKKMEKVLSSFDPGTISFQPDSFSIIQSTLTKNGAVYTELERFKL